MTSSESKLLPNSESKLPPVIGGQIKVQPDQHKSLHELTNKRCQQNGPVAFRRSCILTRFSNTVMAVALFRSRGRRPKFQEILEPPSRRQNLNIFPIYLNNSCI
ncbi:hypothetical protein TNCV_2760041 [Trichonephila clavipes]|nr:hypothetical protein TNCV_2760041 [Trichonephila clavipes]